MPTYVYRGRESGSTFEVQQRITEPALTHHPETGEPVERVIQPAGIVFKGSGFYVTDSRGSSGGAGSKAEGKGEASGEAKPEAKAEAKPEAKAEGKPEPKSERPGTAKPEAKAAG